jgi:hypothetical protein
MRAGGGKFNARSEEFLNSLLKRADRYSDIRFTRPMKEWFNDLHRQAVRRGRRA